MGTHCRGHADEATSSVYLFSRDQLAAKDAASMLMFGVMFLEQYIEMEHLAMTTHEDGMSRHFERNEGAYNAYVLLCSHSLCV